MPKKKLDKRQQKFIDHFTMICRVHDMMFDLEKAQICELDKKKFVKFLKGVHSFVVKKKVKEEDDSEE